MDVRPIWSYHLQQREEKQLFVSILRSKSLFNLPQKICYNFRICRLKQFRNKKKISHIIRVYAGRKAVPSYLRKSLTDAGKSLASIYYTTTLKMDVGQGKQEERPVFYGHAIEIVEAFYEANHWPLSDETPGRFRERLLQSIAKHYIRGF